MMYVLLDGPLAGTIGSGPPVYDYRVPLPPRETHCWCEDELEVLCMRPQEVFEYNAVSRGKEVIFFSKHKNDWEALKHSMQHWVSASGVGRLDKLVYGCQDFGAFE